MDICGCILEVVAYMLCFNTYVGHYAADCNHVVAHETRASMFENYVFVARSCTSDPEPSNSARGVRSNAFIISNTRQTYGEFR